MVVTQGHKQCNTSLYSQENGFALTCGSKGRQGLKKTRVIKKLIALCNTYRGAYLCSHFLLLTYVISSNLMQQQDRRATK